MHGLQEETLVGLDYLQAVTALLQRTRNAHPTLGLYEAADLQWWWGRPRPSDDVGQLFWRDDDGECVAGVVLTEWSDRVALSPVFLPDASPELVAYVVDRGLAHASESGYGAIEVEVSQDDALLRDLLLARGFAITEQGFIAEAWLDATSAVDVSQLHDGYRLTSRADTMDRPHHNGLTGPEVSERLLQTSLYRTGLDLLVVDANENQAAFGVFWFDDATATGLVEPMRTEQEHQKRGLARHVLTAGIGLLAAAGAERIKICYEPSNPASGHLYRSVGFQDVKRTDAMSGQSAAVRA